MATLDLSPRAVLKSAGIVILLEMFAIVGILAIGAVLAFVEGIPLFSAKLRAPPSDMIIPIVAGVALLTLVSAITIQVCKWLIEFARELSN